MAKVILSLLSPFLYSSYMTYCIDTRFSPSFLLQIDDRYYVCSCSIVHIDWYSLNIAIAKYPNDRVVYCIVHHELIL